MGLILGNVLVVLLAPAAWADGRCAPGSTSINANGGVICASVHSPATPAAGQETSTTTAKAAGCFRTGGKQVPCRSAWGTWFSGPQCYGAPMSAPPGSPAWQGHSTGSIWSCTTCSNSVQANTCRAQTIWLPPGSTPGPPDPGELARDALGEIRLATAQVHTAPHAPAPSYVGVENWLLLLTARCVCRSGSPARLSRWVNSAATSPRTSICRAPA